METIVENQAQVVSAIEKEWRTLLTPDALEFVTFLHRKFNPIREKLLQKRQERQDTLDRGESLRFLDETLDVRVGNWQVAQTPEDLADRRVEITGPPDRKMMINALNSGAKAFMADMEDSLSPTWKNVCEGQLNLMDAVRKALSLKQNGKSYQLKDEIATLLVRPRGWHLIEKNVKVDGRPISASLFDFGLFFYHNARELIDRGSGPYFYLPKLESHLEARLWNDVFLAAQNRMGIPRGTIRATVLIETLPAAFEMEEILYELREHSAGLNAGRWDYIFSAIKRFRNHDVTFPDRSQVTMAVPFMRAYAQHLVQICHRRKAHAMGGMSAFIPNRREPDVTKKAFDQVTKDKEREARDGFDGTWVAHPDLVPVAMKVFDQTLGDRPNQKHKLRKDIDVRESELQFFEIPAAKVTRSGIQSNVSVALTYLTHWLEGRGAVAINNLMEDAATAEISRAQLWQWVHSNALMATGQRVDAQLYQEISNEEYQKLNLPMKPLALAKATLDHLVLSRDFEEFLTIPAYRLI